MTIGKYLLTRWIRWKVAEFGTEIILQIYFYHPKVFPPFLSFFLIFCLSHSGQDCNYSPTLANLAAKLDRNCSIKYTYSAKHFLPKVVNIWIWMFTHQLWANFSFLGIVKGSSLIFLGQLLKFLPTFLRLLRKLSEKIPSKEPVS